MAERTGSVRRSRRGRTLALWLVPLAIGSAGCLVEKGRCGPNQENNAVGNCVCKFGFVASSGQTCVPCGPNEVSVGDVCVCGVGYARKGAECVEATADVGAPCNTNADCPSGGPHCHHEPDGASYCTITGCTQMQECPGGYGCDTEQSPSVCLRAPTGLFETCQSQDDCAGKEASFCESAVYKVCTVPNCRTDADCFASLECCDLTAYGLPTLCVAEGVCPVE